MDSTWQPIPYRGRPGTSRPSRLPVSRSLLPTLTKNSGGGVEKESSSRDRDLLPYRGMMQHRVGGGENENDGESLEEEKQSREMIMQVDESGRPSTLPSISGRDLRVLRRPRPSLSDRAIESLSQIPPSPSPRRRKSGFFPESSPARAPSRSGGAIFPSRPAMACGSPPPLATPTAHSRSIDQMSPSGKAASRAPVGSPRRKMARSTSGTPLNTNSVSKITVGSKTLTARPVRERLRAEDLFTQEHTAGKSKEKASDGRNLNAAGSRSLKVSTQKVGFSKPPNKPVHHPAPQPIESTEIDASARKTDKSSVALRKAIADAKAARIRQLHGNPLGNAGIIVTQDASILDKRLEMARTDGRLNISDLSLEELPSKIVETYDRSAMDFADDAVFQTVALTKVTAADNNIKQLSDYLFPESYMQGSTVFEMLETLDLHGNSLEHLPAGFGNLHSLANLNLSRNGLTHVCLDILSQLSSLQELNLSSNKLEGNFESDLFSLASLQILDMSDNALTELPPTLVASSKVRKLALAGNRLISLPLDGQIFSSLIELDVSRNRLSGTFLGGGISMSCMRILDVSSNALAELCEDNALHAPELQILRLSENRVQSIPNLSSCGKLMTLSAAANNISDFPDSIVSLPLLANADLSRNALRSVDERIGLMENLTLFNIANNPIPQRRLMSMATDLLKKEMRERLDGS